jgi:predicted metal-binding protein
MDTITRRFCTYGQSKGRVAEVEDGQQRDSGDLRKLTELACQLGASNARVISTKEISIEEDLAKLCREPQCENYGLSASCPPHVAGPSGFRKLLQDFERAVVFKIEIPLEVLLSSDRREVFRALHEVAASIEHSAVEMGYHHSRAYAGGSCKRLFCQDYTYCRILKEGGECRNPGRARPSMSGFGINVSKLMQAAGWTMSPITQDNSGNKASMSLVCGLVLIG